MHPGSSRHAFLPVGYSRVLRSLQRADFSGDRTLTSSGTQRSSALCDPYRSGWGGGGGDVESCKCARFRGYRGFPGELADAGVVLALRVNRTIRTDVESRRRPGIRGFSLFGAGRNHIRPDRCEAPCPARDRAVSHCRPGQPWPSLGFTYVIWKYCVKPFGEALASILPSGPDVTVGGWKRLSDLNISNRSSR